MNPAMRNADTALSAALGKLRAEQGRRGTKPSREVALAITNAQQALMWLRQAQAEDEGGA